MEQITPACPRRHQHNRTQSGFITPRMVFPQQPEMQQWTFSPTLDCVRIAADLAAATSWTFYLCHQRKSTIKESIYFLWYYIACAWYLAGHDVHVVVVNNMLYGLVTWLRGYVALFLSISRLTFSQTILFNCKKTFSWKCALSALRPTDQEVDHRALWVGI